MCEIGLENARNDTRRILRLHVAIDVARKRGLKGLEDCSQSVGASYKGRPLGSMGDIGIYSLQQSKTITAGEWKQVCAAAETIKSGDDQAARQFFESNFRPFVVQVPGRFTGYFEPELRGSRAPSRLFTVPVCVVGVAS